MKRICSYCKTHLGDKEPLDDHSLSHTMCDTCFQYFDHQWGGLSLDSFLDEFPSPILVVEPKGRVVAANQAMQNMLGRQQNEIRGFLGGEIMSCIYARLPEGCGNTMHCIACTIRQTVNMAFITNEPQLNIPAFLNHVNGQKMSMTISVYPENNTARIVIGS